MSHLSSPFAIGPVPVPVRRSSPRLTTLAEFMLLMILAFAAGVILAGYMLPELPR